MTPPASSARVARLVWGLSLAQLVSWGILFYSVAVFVVPMRAELGWSRTSLNAGITIGLLTSAAFAPWVGARIDRGQAWPVMTLGSLLGSAAVAAWACVETPAGFWLIWVAMGMALSCTLYEPAFAVLSRALGDAAPRAVLKMTMVGGLASTAFIPLTHLLIERIGWRPALLALAAINLVLATAVHAFVLDPRLLPPAPAPPSRPPVTARAALADSRFWGLLIAFAAYNVAFTAMTFHFLPLLEERDVSRDVGVALFTLIGPLQVAGRLLLFAGGNEIASRKIGRVVFVISVPLFLLAAYAGQNLVLLGLFVAVYGVINGVSTVIRGMIVRDIFGTHNYGAIAGSLTLPATIARAAGPAFGALMWSIGEVYLPMLLALAALCALGAVAYWLATRGVGAP